MKKHNYAIPRRDFILYGLSLFSTTLLFSCERHRYDRVSEQKELELDLGPVKSLLYNEVHVPLKSALVMRDLDGWYVLSTRCTYEGCDLTVQHSQGRPPTLFCPCCKSAFNIQGEPLQGSSAAEKLPWMEMFYKEGHLYARPGKPVNANYRFTTPQIEEAVRKLKLMVRDEKISDGANIPKSLLGGGNEEEGVMFIDQPSILAE